MPRAVAYCRSIPNPPPGVVPRAMRVKDGQFNLPGCVPGRTYPVLVFDPNERRGALAEVQVPAPAAPPPTVRVEACGNATVRLVDAAGKSIVGCRAFIYLWLNWDRPVEAPASDDQTPPDALLPLCCGNNPVLGLETDADGRLELRGVLPGPEYGVSFMIAAGREIHSPRFRVAPGQALNLTVVVQPPKESGSHPPGATPE